MLWRGKEKEMFSVVVPAYNCDKTIYDSLKSVADQTRLDLIEEIIVVNDGSKDNTKKEVLRFMNDYPNVRVMYLEQENRGVSCARNKAILAAKADWIALLDSDDLWLVNKIERQEQVIREDKNILFLGSFYPIKFFFTSYKSGLHKITPYQLCIRNMPNSPSVVFHRDSAIKLGLFNEKRRHGEDIEFFQKFFLLDSYYILAEELVKISYDKVFFAEKGLSSNLRMMHKGRNRNTVQLHKMGMINGPFLYSMLVLNEIKYLRRRIENKINSLRFKRVVYKKKESNNE